MLIERKEYLDKLLAWKDKQLVKVITGVRRCGKSTLMEMFQSRLKNDGVEEKRILSVNFEDYDFYDLRDPAKLYAYIKEWLDPNVMNYIFLDEVQHVELYLFGRGAARCRFSARRRQPVYQKEYRFVPDGFQRLYAFGGDCDPSFGQICGNIHASALLP